MGVSEQTFYRWKKLYSAALARASYVGLSSLRTAPSQAPRLFASSISAMLFRLVSFRVAHGSRSCEPFSRIGEHSFEALELADELLDAGAGPIEHLRKNRAGSSPLPCTGSRGRWPCRGPRAVLRFAYLFADGGARLDVRTEVEQDLEHRAVAAWPSLSSKASGSREDR